MSDDAAKQPEWLTVDEVAAILRIGRNQAYRAIANGEIPSRRIGKTIRVRRAALEKDE